MIILQLYNSVPRAQVTALDGSSVEEVSCGGTHTLVRTRGGAVWTAGRGDDGRLGVGDCTGSAVPRRVAVVDAEGRPAAARAIAAGGAFSMIIVE